MTKIFKHLIDRTMEVYIDDIIVKNGTWDEHIQHLEETFHLMLAYNMKLNLARCAFGVCVGKFLGFMVTERWIEVNPYQIKVILETLVPSRKKELQRLTGRLVAFERFIAYFTDKSRPFFLMLRGASTCGWTDECKQTFEVVKRYLIEPPIRSSPNSDKQLYMYLVVSDCAVSVVLFRYT